MGGEEFAGDDGEAGEVAGAEEADQWADEEERQGALDESEERDERGGDEQIGDVGALVVEAVGEVAEGDVAEEGAGLHEDGPAGGLDDGEAAAPLDGGQGEEVGDPGEEAPPGEEGGRVHGGADEGAAGERRAEELGEWDFGGVLALPGLGLGKVAAEPEGDEGGEDAGEEDGAPAEVREDEGDEGRAEGVADSPGALDEGEGFGAMAVGPGFGDEGCAGGPFAAHAEAEEQAAGQELRGGVSEAAEGCRDGVDEDAEGEGAGAAEAVGEPAEGEASRGRGQERGGDHGAAGGGGEAELALDRAEDERVEHNVHAVEHPAEGGGEEDALLVAGGLGEPGGEMFQKLSLGLGTRFIGSLGNRGKQVLRYAQDDNICGGAGVGSCFARFWPTQVGKTRTLRGWSAGMVLAVF